MKGGIVGRHLLFERLGRAGRITEVSAPAGSGKTILLRSWIDEAGLVEHAALVSVQGEQRDPQRFWISVADALRDTRAGSALVRPLTAAPDLDGWAVVERLLADLGSLQDRIWLVIDDLHELGSAEALRQLELLLMRAPAELRFLLVTRHDLRLGLHRLRLEGELTEIRAANLRFTLDEARALLEAAGVQLSESALALVHERTEGWAAGLRLAALSLVRHPDPERFAAEFSGSERTVAEYLLAEVLERQPERVRRLLLRTSVLERVNGPLADLLTGGSGGEGILQDLEQAGAFVISLGPHRSWFRYHRLFADLLQLELRRTEPAELPALHGGAARWYAGHGYLVEAVRHAQAARDWDLAARLLSDHWVDLELNGQAATARQLLTAFPAGVAAADAELTVLMAAGELNRGSLGEAERQLALAIQRSESVPADRRGHFQVMLTVLRLSLARQRSDLRAVAGEADRLLAAVEAPDTAQLGLGEDLRALALISLGVAEIWALRFADADRHLEEGVALARRIQRPYLELTGLAQGSLLAVFRSYQLGAQRSRQAIDLAERHGWSEEPITGIAYGQLGGALLAQGRLEEAGGWLGLAERTLRADTEPAAGMMLHYARGGLEMTRGRYEEALVAFRTAERLAELLARPNPVETRMRLFVLLALLGADELDRVDAALAEMDPHDRESGETRTILAALRLAQDDPEAAAEALAPVLEGSAPVASSASWLVLAFLLEAMARDALGDQAAAGRALEHALYLAEPDGVLWPFLYHPAPGLMERHTRRPTSHAVLVSEILDILAPGGPGGYGGYGGAGSPPVSRGGLGRIAPPEKTLHEPLSDSETRVLRYLPTNLSAPELAGELHLSVNTIRTHMRHLYQKLGAHRRAEAVDRARSLGLLAPSPRRP